MVNGGEMKIELARVAYQDVIPKDKLDKILGVEMSETREEYLAGIDQGKRKDLLRDMEVPDLMDLFPDTDTIRELLIDEIINNSWDKQVNDEVK